MCFLTYTELITALPFFKRVDEPFMEALNPYNDKQGLLKNQNNFLEPIWLAGPILPSALVDIVDSRGGVEDPTFETTTNDLKKTSGQGLTF